MGFCRQIEAMRLKAKGLSKPLKTRLFSSNYFFVESKRVLRAFSCFEVPSVLTNFTTYAVEKTVALLWESLFVKNVAEQQKTPVLQTCNPRYAGEREDTRGELN